jgi:predicted DNA-binding transcriptional regulator AlpA
MKNKRYAPRLRTPEAAEFLGVAPATLEKWRYERSDGPPFRKLGTVVVYELSELEQWLARHTVRFGADGCRRLRRETPGDPSERTP